MNTSKHLHRLPPSVYPAPLAAAFLSLGLISFAACAAPQGAVVRAGEATISASGASTRIEQRTDRAVIDWRSFSVDAPESVLFNQPSHRSATLNRVTGDQLSRILGRIEANGQLVLVNPNGIVFGSGSRVDVGSLIATTANLSDKDFMAGRMRFVEPGKPGAGISNHGTLSVAEGGLVALVAPHVTNGGLIQARLGKVALGAGDTFTLDLYGDDLIHLALAPDQPFALLDETGKPLNGLISQAGEIAAAGGQVVLITAPTAKAVLDQVINLSGTIQADTAEQRNGHVVLLGRGGEVEVRGTISAQGTLSGQTGGTIEILGDVVHLTNSARAHAGGSQGGGTIHVGGAYQGQETTYRSRVTTVDAGASLAADATRSGEGGDVVVWSDGHTYFAGDISARGGASSGNGGQIEVSGRGSLDFAGLADAGAPSGVSGMLLLDPAFLDIGAAEAGLISFILRNGTSTTLTATNDIRLNALIDGRGGIPDAGLAMSAGRDVFLNQSIVTNNGAIDLSAGGQVISSTGTGLFSSGGAVSVSAGSGIFSGDVLANGGPIRLWSGAGAISLNGDLATGAAGDITLTAEGGSIVSAAGKGIYADQGKVALAARSLDVPVISTIGGYVELTATDGHMNLNDVIHTLGGAVIAWSSGPLVTGTGKGIFSGNGKIDLTGASIAINAPLDASGDVTLNSTSGDIILNHEIGKTNGDLTLTSAGKAILQRPIQNTMGGHDLSVEATGDIYVEAPIGGQSADPLGAPSGSVSLSSTQGSLYIKEPIATHANTIILISGRSVEAGDLFSATGDILVSGAEGIALKKVVAMKGPRCSPAENCPLGGFISIMSQRGDIALNGDVITNGDQTTQYDESANSNGDISITAETGNVTLNGGFIGTSSADLIIRAGNEWNYTGSAKLNADLIRVYDKNYPSGSGSPSYQSEAGEFSPPTQTQNHPQQLVTRLPEIPPLSVMLPRLSIKKALDNAESRLVAESTGLIALPQGSPTYSETAVDHSEISPQAIIFTGGRGFAQSADLGRNGSIGNILDVFLFPLPLEDERKRRTLSD